MIPNKNPAGNKKHVAFHLALLACQAATFFWSLRLRKLVLLSCTCCTFNPAHTRTSALRYIGIPEPNVKQKCSYEPVTPGNVQRPNQIETRHAAMLLDLKWIRTLLLRSTPKILGCKQVLPPKTLEFPQNPVRRRRVWCDLCDKNSELDHLSPPISWMFGHSSSWPLVGSQGMKWNESPS